MIDLFSTTFLPQILSNVQYQVAGGVEAVEGGNQQLTIVPLM